MAVVGSTTSTVRKNPRQSNPKASMFASQGGIACGNIAIVHVKAALGKAGFERLIQTSQLSAVVCCFLRKCTHYGMYTKRLFQPKEARCCASARSCILLGDVSLKRSNHSFTGSLKAVLVRNQKGFSLLCPAASDAAGCDLSEGEKWRL